MATISKVLKRKVTPTAPPARLAGPPLAPTIAQNPELLAHLQAAHDAAFARDAALLARIKAALPELEALHAASIRRLGDYEDGLYRFYHQSYKVYGL